MNYNLRNRNKFYSILLVFIIILSCAENESLAPEEDVIPLETMLTGGPAENEILPFNSTVTFTWDGKIKPGYITNFSYSFSQVLNDTTLILIEGDTALIRSYSRSNLMTGKYRFEVFAHSVYQDSIYSDKTPEVRNFLVDTGDPLVPVITILYGPKEDSYAVTGSNVLFQWQANDPSSNGSISSYSFVLADSALKENELDWSEPRLETTQMAFYNLQNGTYRFWIKATDVSGLSSIIKRDFVIKNADILFVIDQQMTLASVDFWHEHLLRDFAYEDYYLTSDPADFSSMMDPNTYSSIVWAGGNDISNLSGGEFVKVDSSGTVAAALKNYIDTGGHLWISGSDILYSLGGDVWAPTIYPENSFAKEILHIDSSSADYANFQGAISTGIGDYNSIIVDGNATFHYCHRIDPDQEAETILTFSSQLDSFHGESVAIRYPAGASEPGDTKVVYFGFYITDFSDPEVPISIKASDIYTMATTVLTDFGENND